MYGISEEVLGDIDKENTRMLDNLESVLRKNKVIADGVNIDEQKVAAHGAFTSGIAEKYNTSHAAPMKRVIGMLPLDELAELAEILIRIESLKERVTKNSEQISGPIDVAVISKGDGFIWIKRKHYFDAKLNPRFFARRGMKPHGE